MIDAEGIKVSAHLAKALFPPCEAALLHQGPIVGGKTPVLAFIREWVGRRSGLRVHMIKFRSLPGIGAVPVHADGDIALKNNSLRMGVFRCFFELNVQVILKEE